MENKKVLKLDDVTCFRCGKKGHLKRNCHYYGSFAKEDPARPEEADSDMSFIDTHCHIDLVYERSGFKGSFSDFKLEKNFNKNFEGCITSFCEPYTVLCDELWTGLLSEGTVWGAFGMHPRHSSYYSDDFEWKLVQCMEHPKAIALGEIGLDYSERCTTPRDLQIHTFKRLLTWAVTLNKPVVIHCREAEEQLLASMIELLPSDWKIHVHCFTGGMAYAKRIMDLFSNAFFGVTNLVTFPSAREIHRQVKELPLDKILIETDAPYFVPMAWKSKIRYSLPSDGLEVAKEIAKLRGNPLDAILTQIRLNTSKMYGI